MKCWSCNEDKLHEEIKMEVISGWLMCQDCRTKLVNSLQGLEQREVLKDVS